MFIRVIASILFFTHSTYAEFLLYKVDPQDPQQKRPVDFVDIKVSQHLVMLYMNTIRKWAPPFCFGLKKEERTKEYMEALDQPYGLLIFLDKKAKELSNNRYGITWIPTSLYEIISLLIISENKNIFNCLYPVLAGEEKKETIVDGQLKSVIELRGTCAEIMHVDFLKNLWLRIDSYAFHMNALFFFLNNKALEYRHSVSPLDSVVVSKAYDNVLLYDGSKKALVESYILYEKEALIHNQFLLSRGSNGYALSDEKHFLDYDFGAIDGLSYGYSLFAGSFFDKREIEDSLVIQGARSLDYMSNYKIGYVIPIKIKDFFEQVVFVLPYISTLESLFGNGEFFHPRSKICLQHTLDHAYQMSGILSQAKIISFLGHYHPHPLIDMHDIAFRAMHRSRRIELYQEFDLFKNIINPLLAGLRYPILESDAKKIIDMVPASTYYLLPNQFMQYISEEHYLKNDCQFSPIQKSLILRYLKDLSSFSEMALTRIVYYFPSFTPGQVKSLTKEQLEYIFDQEVLVKHFESKLHYVSEEQIRSLDRIKVPERIYNYLTRVHRRH